MSGHVEFIDVVSGQRDACCVFCTAPSFEDEDPDSATSVIECGPFHIFVCESCHAILRILPPLFARRVVRVFSAYGSAATVALGLTDPPDGTRIYWSASKKELAVTCDASVQ